VTIVCVMQCLRRYKAITQQYRTKNPNSSQPLFLSYVKPHGPVTSQRLAHWLKEILGKAGVDTSVFKAQVPQVRWLQKRGYLMKIFFVLLIGVQISHSGDFIIIPFRQMFMPRLYCRQELNQREPCLDTWCDYTILLDFVPLFMNLY